MSRKYVWYNTRDDILSKSWTLEENSYRWADESEMFEELLEDSDSEPYWKLLKFECINDAGFNLG